MNKTLPSIHESAAELKAVLIHVWRREEQHHLHALDLLVSGHAWSRITLAAFLSVSRDTIGRWVAIFTQGGLSALLDIMKLNKLIRICYPVDNR